jgi:hypothetical protein
MIQSFLILVENDSGIVFCKLENLPVLTSEISVHLANEVR